MPPLPPVLELAVIDTPTADVIAAVLHGPTDAVGPWVDGPHGRTRPPATRDTRTPNDVAVTAPGPTVADMTTTPSPTPSPGSAFAKLADKAVWTFVEVFAAAWLASGSLGLDGAQQWLAAGLAAAATVIANGSPASVSTSFGVDFLYRLIRTYVASFVGLWGASVAAAVAGGGDALTASAASAAAWAAVPAVVTFLKGTAAKMLADRGVGNPDTAALLPASVDRQFAIAA